MKFEDLLASLLPFAEPAAVEDSREITPYTVAPSADPFALTT